MANEVNIYTPRYLAEVVRQAPPVHTFFRDTFFTNVQHSPTESVDIDIVKGNRRMAAFVHPRIGGEVLKSDGYKTESYKPPLVNPYDETTADRYMTRMPGEDLYSGMTPAQRAAKKLMGEYASLNDATTRREEWMAVQAIVTGQIPIVGKGVNEIIDFGFTNTETLTSTAQWGKSAAKISDNLEDWADKVLTNGFANVDMAIMGKTALRNFLADEKISKMLDNRRVEIQQGMMNGSYVLGPYRKLWVYVPKKRLVMALDYPDRIVQWSLYLYLNPIYDRLFIEDSYACRKGKGSHKAAKRLQYWMCQVQRKPGPGWYCLKLDISKYFYRVNHEKLLAILERRVKDPAMMAFIRGVVNSRAEPFGLPRWRTPQDTPPEEWMYEVGMPIGNLTSQLFANIYLNELDQYCKHRLKIHYYIRYMDDVIILGQDKETLHRWKAAVETFLQEELALDLNSKTSIRPVCQGVEFVGVRIWPTHMKLRKSTVRRIKREVRKISALYAAGDMTRQDFYRRIASIRGLLKHTESASLRWRLNEIYRAELEKAKQKQLREEAQHEPFADHSGAGNGDGNAGTGYQDHGNPACRAG